MKKYVQKGKIHRFQNTVKKYIEVTRMESKGI